MSKLHKVTIKPTGEVVEVPEGVNLLKALRDQSCYVKSSCGGHATCSDCIIKVVSGEDYLTPPPFDELKLLGNVFHITKERLACQTCVTGDVTIDLSNHDKDSDEVKMKSKSSSFAKKKLQTRVRKESDVKKLNEEKEKERIEFDKEEKTKSENWQKHWEREKNADGTPKRLQGGRRPKFFDTDKVDYESDQYTRPLSKEKQKLKDDREKLAREDHYKNKVNKEKEYLDQNDIEEKSGIIEQSDKTFKKFR